MDATLTHAGTQAQAAVRPLLAQVLDEIDCGLMLLTRHGRLCQANRVAARRWLAARTLRLDASERVQAQDAGDDQRLQRALAQAVAGRRGMVTLRGAGEALTLACVPLRAPCTDDAGGADGADSVAGTRGAAHVPAVLLICGRPRGDAALALEFFAREHGLTLAETSVLRSLADGATPAAAADACGVALSTVRTHIGALRAKTGAHSLTQLLHRVTALPPMATAWH